MTIDVLNVRLGPGSNFSVVDKVYLNNKLSVYSSQNGWVSISPENNRWVFDIYTSKIINNSVVPSRIAPVVPSGFTLLNMAKGIELYKKNYSGGQPDFVQVVDLNQAKVRFFAGDVVNMNPGQGIFGGNSPLIKRNSLSGFWNAISVLEPKIFSICNSQFFVTGSDPTYLAFSVKQDNVIFNDGYASYSEYPGQKKLLGFKNDNTADVITFSQSNLYNSSNYYQMILGLDVLASKASNSYVGRTFIGAKNNLFFVYSTKMSNQSDAINVLKSFGVESQNIIMLDGGGSSGLMVNKQVMVQMGRTVPHTIACIPND
ncbi:MAG: hypothetical protein ACD_18C00069G0001 [uncultured bacterium]|nr:MAG: hypothetical protein ACD_18C00069G0001 [uncultured bacterium]